MYDGKTPAIQVEERDLNLHEILDERVRQCEAAYYRLILVVGPSKAGKTAALRGLNSIHGWPLVNLNLRLSERLLDLTIKRRALRVATLVADIANEYGNQPLLIDNIEMLFHPDLKQDPLRLLQSLSRNRTIIVTWRGAYVGTSLTYAAPDHPEFRRFDDPQALIVSSAGSSDRSGATPTREHSA